MIPALAAAFAKPAVKYGAIAGGVVLLVAVTNWKTYNYVLAECEESKLAAIAQQAHESAQQALKGAEMSSMVAGDVDKQANAFRAQITELERKVARNAKQKPCALDPGFVQLLDEYGRLLNATPQNSVSSADGGTGKPEVPRGGVDHSSPQVVPVEGEDGAFIELTTQDLNRYVADLARKYGSMKLKYRGLSEFDDQRLAIERQRLQEEAP